MSPSSGLSSSVKSSRRGVFRSLQKQTVLRLFNSRYTLSLGAQALVSGFHFTLNLVLLRIVSQYDYGVFAFAFVLAMFAQAINNALVSTPLTVYTPVLKDPAERQQQESMLGSANLLFFLALILCGGIYSLFSPSAPSMVLAVTFFIAVYSARHFSRSFGYARMRPLVTALGDLTYVACGVLLITVVILRDSETSVSQVLTALALANLVAMLLERSLLHGAVAFRFTWRYLSNYHLIWQQSRWALAGALTTLFMSQAHSLIVTSFLSPAAFAPLAAGFVLFGPLRVALVTWQNMVKPEFAVDIADKQTSKVIQRVLQTTLLMAVAVILMSIAIYLCWPLIHHLLYAKKYADEPMGLIVAIWSIITLFAAIYNAPSAALQALKDFKVLAYASIYGSIISAISVTLALLWINAEATLIGILLAEVFTAVFLIKVMNAKLREKQ